MSFITKRERVFAEYLDPFDLPPRNEGKLKAYGSCTDARAWSHFGSDQTEHLVELIKKNNETCRGKYVPVNVIVETMMAAKNAEIARLKRQVAQLEDMLAVFDELELSCEQKCEIATAHAMIKAANKSLDDLALDLDVSNFTEGSEGFQTGKSGGDEGSGKGDEWDVQKKVSKINQVELTCICDASTSAHDFRVDEMQEALISKDAKLSAMQNTIAVMENDVCEPYCVYAHIYTALEKIFATLRQNDKYRLFLDLMSSGKDTRCVDIKGKILFKLKILEKFGIALLAPCSERFKQDDTCKCTTTQIMHLETTFTHTTSESKKLGPDSKRAQLVADIMQNDDMKEILDKDSFADSMDQEQPNEISIDNYSIDTENLNRLKNLQRNYDELMNCYENVKHERDNLKARCQKYDELEQELENLRAQLREYNSLYNEREHYRKRSEDLDSLKEQYLVLADETSNLETQLKAEVEINGIKSDTIEELRLENIALEKKLNDSVIAFEKENNALQCKLKETECTVMCQDQQIRSLSLQIDRILEQDQAKQQDVPNPAVVMEEIEALKEQIKNLKEALYYSEEEKQQLQKQFEDSLEQVNNLKLEIEDWKSAYEKTLQRNEYLEKYTDDVREELDRLADENKNLSIEAEEKSTAVANLLNVIHNKSQEVNKLMEEIDDRRTENKRLHKQVQEIRDQYGSSVIQLENENKEALDSLQVARQESQELLEKVKDYNELLHKQKDMSASFEKQTADCNELKNMLMNTIEENKRLQMDLNSQENNNSILLQEIQRLRDVNKYALDNMNSLQNEKQEFQQSLELTRKESEILEDKVQKFEDLRQQMQELKLSHEKLSAEKIKIEMELELKSKDLNEAVHSVALTKKESERLLEKIEKSENLKEDMIQLSKDYHKLVNDKQTLQKDLTDKNKEIKELLEMLSKLKNENKNLRQTSEKANELEKELSNLKQAYDELSKEKALLQTDFDNKTDEINNLYNTLEAKIEENRDLLEQIKTLEHQQLQIQDTNMTTRLTLDAVRKESAELINKLRAYETVVKELDALKKENEIMKEEKGKLENDLKKQSQELKKIGEENEELGRHAETIMAQNETLERALLNTRNELIQSTEEGPLAKVVKEIEVMKNEKIANHQKIRELLDKLDDTENTVADLNEELLARDDKIVILQNHINSLEDEVRRLQEDLAKVVTTGEEIKDNSYQKIDHTLNIMEAHHSKATHNMKVELAKLHNENAKLEDELSLTKIKSEESFRERHKYVSQLIHLQNEREIIIADIKQKELGCFNDSNLSPDSTIEDILRSLERIQKCLDAKQSKSSTLEQKLLKVQTSSQLLLSKADEAKRLVEKEKQKIITEKEEAIADRLNMERQLMELKLQLEQQNKNDKAIIKELEAEMLNQELIIGKFKESTESYVAKLKDEMQALQDLYQNALATINDLQGKLQDATNENDKNKILINSINKDLKQKAEEVTELQKSIGSVKSKPTNETGIQIGESHNKRNADVQVDKSEFKKNSKTQTEQLPGDITLQKEGEDIINMSEINMPGINKPKHKPTSDHVSSDLPQNVNEVQILTANVDNTLDFVKSSYIDYKIKRLGPGKIEQYSISEVNNIDSNIDGSVLVEDGVFSPIASTSQNTKLIDIYNRPSMQTTSSKVVTANDDDNTLAIGESKNPIIANKSSGLTGFNLTHDISDSKSNMNSTPDKSTDKDLFLIYQDSESSQMEKQEDERDWMSRRQAPILAEAFTIKTDTQAKFIKVKEQLTEEPSVNKEYNKVSSDTDRLKHRIQIELPIIKDGSANSHETLSLTESERKFPNALPILSPESRNILPNLEESLEEFIEPNVISSKKPTSSQKRSEKSEKDRSHHDLSRVDADFLLLKDGNNNDDGTEEGLLQQKQKHIPSTETGKFGLEYILDTVKRELNPSEIKDHKKLRKTRSDNISFQTKGSFTSDINSSEYYKTTSNSRNSPHKLSEYSPQKSVAEQSVTADINANYYENKIRYLTKLLENTEKDCKTKLDAIRAQYDSNIKSIINEHNQGVKSIQGLHEETLQDIIKIHENETENLRTMSIEAMRKAERLEKENRLLKGKVQDCGCGCEGLSDGQVRMSTTELKKRRSRCRGDTRMLTKTNVEAFNVKPKLKVHGPCSCSLDVNVSDTIRNIFEQVDVEQRKLAEHAYLKYIANKILSASVEALDAQELSFLHLKVCRTWKSKLNKEELLQKRIDTLESEMVMKQRNAQQHIAELDRKVAEERQRLQEVREAVCRSTSGRSSLLDSRTGTALSRSSVSPPPPPPPTANTELPLGACSCTSRTAIEVIERLSAGDLIPGASGTEMRLRRTKKPESRAVLARLDVEERREKKLYDEHPTRLRRAHDRQALRPRK